MSLDPKDIILEAEQYGKAPTDIRISLTSAPVPDCAWMATREGWEPGSLYGLGRTPIVALADLLAREIEFEDESGESFVPSFPPIATRRGDNAGTRSRSEVASAPADVAPLDLMEALKASLAKAGPRANVVSLESDYCSCGAIHDGLEEFQRCKSCGKII